MTTLKETLFSRSAKACFAVLLAASLVPISALPSAAAFAEDNEGDATGFTTEVNDAQALVYNASDEEGAVDDEAGSSADEGPEATGAPNSSEENPSANEAGPTIAADASEAVLSVSATEETGTVTDIQLESLETTVEDTNPFNFFAPFRLLFGAAADGFTVPLKAGHYEKWIDRLNLSGAVDADGVNYAQTFYNTLIEASDNDNTADWLIDWGLPNMLNSSGKVGGVYQVPDYPSGTVGILTTVITNNETPPAEGLTPSEDRVREYLNEVYGAFDRDYPTSFWRDLQFGTVFWRPTGTTRSYAVFLLKSTSEKYPLDIRANGYRSADTIRNAIDIFNNNVAAIKADYAKDPLSAENTDYARVKFYNDWLCEHNQYNTNFGNISQQTDPDVWSAMSAIAGRTGDEGPVCEGYSRAMKVLCDSDNIGCVLVDGYAVDAGPHMWNYVRIGSNWYAVDVTWNDSGAGATSSAYDEYLLKGREPFETTHPPSNQFVEGGTKFTNGPQLAENDYNPNSLSFAGDITGLGPFAYGDEIPLQYNASTPGDVTYEVENGPATVNSAATVAETMGDGATHTLVITGTGDITVKATLAPSGSSSSLSDTITITAGPRPLKTNGTVIAPKVYDGTVQANVIAPGSLISARTAPSYAAVGVLDADKADIGVTMKADSAAFLNSNAAMSQEAVATYELTSPTNNAAKLKLYTLEGHETENTSGTITKRPVTAYFALTSTRVLTTEELPAGTVRFENASGNRGKLVADELLPADANIRTEGMPSAMPTDIPAGDSRTYNVTWASPTSSVLTEIAKAPAAANYQVELSTDTAANTVVLTIVNLDRTIVLPAENPADGTLYRVECRVNGINNETTDALKDSGFTSTEDIVSKLVEKLSPQMKKPLSTDRVNVYDMTLYVQNGDDTWVRADESNFPSAGVRVTVEYPKDTKGDTHSFYAAHMFSHEIMSGGTVHKVGEIETPQVLNGPDGAFFTLMGFSPVAFAWEDVTPSQAVLSPGDDSGSGHGTGITQQTSQNANGGLSQTGDSMPVLSITVVVLACIVLLVALVVRRNRGKDGDKKS